MNISKEFIKIAENKNTDGALLKLNVHDVTVYPSEENVQYLFNVKDRVEAVASSCQHSTATCKVTDRKTEPCYYIIDAGELPHICGYKDMYYLEKCSGSSFISGWYDRSSIEK